MNRPGQYRVPSSSLVYPPNTRYPGQPPQRPPNMAPNAGLPGPFRGPYPNYGMPPRSVIQGGYVPGLQPSNHRAATVQQAQAQSIVPQPSPGFLPQRQNTFPFAGGLSQIQSHQPPSLQQHASSNPSQLSQLQQQANGPSSTQPSHLPQSSATPSLSGTAPSVSSASEVGLDPNDFPALGSTPSNITPSNHTNGAPGNGTTTSYASQAGTGVLLAPGSGASGTSGLGIGGVSNASGAAASTNQPRDFTPDDFPALSGHVHSQSQNSNSHPPPQNQDNHQHPPGLNGFQHGSEHSQQHRQTLLGSLGGGAVMPQTTPGMLNLGPTQARAVHPGFQQSQAETEKQQQRNNYAMKLNQATHAAWNASAVNSSSQTPLGASTFNNPSSATTAQPNGAHSNANPPQAPQQPTSQSQLNAPPGVTLPANSYVQTGHTHGTSAAAVVNSSSGPQPYPSNGLLAGEQHPNNANPNQNRSMSTNPHNQMHTNYPQTPSQQVLVSAADRWGLLGLLAMIKNAGTDLDQGLSSVGTDLGTMGLDMGYPGNLYSTFITPWADQSAARTVEPDFHLPACYNVQPAAPGPSKVQGFNDETLFYMFYSCPKDALQEVAAQELWNRNWRYHKEMRLWITKEAGTTPSQKVPGGEQGVYTFWDAENWGKERKEMTVLYADLEEKSVPVFVHGPGLVIATPQAAQAQAQQLAQQLQQQQHQQHQHAPGQQTAQLQPIRGGSYQMGMAGL